MDVFFYYSEGGFPDREDGERGAGVAEDGVGVARPLAPPPAPASTSSSSASSGESDVGASPSPDHQVRKVEHQILLCIVTRVLRLNAALPLPLQLLLRIHFE